MKVLYASEDAFDRVPLPEWGKPALGGLCVGAIGIFFPQAFGVGYSTIGQALHGALSLELLGALLFVKLAATCITIGSGGSVGREGPIVQIGSAVGSALGQALRVPARQLRTIVGCGAAAGWVSIGGSRRSLPLGTASPATASGAKVIQTASNAITARRRGRPSAGFFGNKENRGIASCRKKNC